MAKQEFFDAVAKELEQQHLARSKSSAKQQRHQKRNHLMVSDPEQIPGGYWRAVAQDLISDQLIKRFLGRSYLRLGQCFGPWGYLFELGGILGAKHGAK